MVVTPLHDRSVAHTPGENRTVYSGGSPEAGSTKPRLFDLLHDAIKVRNYSPRTEQNYRMWIRRYIHFHNIRHPDQMGETEINAFLTHLAVHQKVAASTQNQALSALIFLYRNVLGIEIGDLGTLIRAKKPQRLPVVLDRREIRAIRMQLGSEYLLMVDLLYGCGLRQQECLQLRVQAVDFVRRQVLVRDGKGQKDRTTMLPESLADKLQDHLKKVRTIHQKDLDEGWGKVQLPNALDRKFPNAASQWGWQWVFPQSGRWRNHQTGEQGRHYLDASLLQKAIRRAATQAGIVKRVTCHTFRHSFATHLLEDGYDIRTIQELLGHKDLKTTMIYTHVLNKGPAGVRSPIDSL